MSSSSTTFPKILIIMTAPFNNGDSSRTLDSYFHYWDKKCVAQVYSRNCIPTKGHCSSFFQITDERIVKCWLGREEKPGRVFEDGALEEASKLSNEYSGPVSKAGYAIGAKHTPIIELLRGVLWRKRFWCTQDFVAWLDNYNPDCVLYNFSNHLFTQDIALFVAERYNIPIIPIIGDDYYFNDRASLSPAYHLFRVKFKQLTEKIMSHSVNAIYCSEKCMKKYGSYFGLNGKPIYVSSGLNRRKFRPINGKDPKFLYCGSVRLGRNYALVEIADALRAINRDYILDVYTGDSDAEVCRPLVSHPNINFCGRVGYDKIEHLISECDVFVVAEGFRSQDLLFTRYSLSTKAADGLASGAQVFAYGPADAGVIEYLASTEATAVCDDQRTLIDVLRNMINDVQFQKECSEKAISATNRNHTLRSSTRDFFEVVKEALDSNTEMRD